MAESSLLAPIFRSAVGGLSDDLFNGVDGTFFSSKNINIRDNAKAISLNKKLVKDSGIVITEKINTILKTSAGKFMAFGASGGLYWKDTTTWAKITTDSPATEIYSAIEFNGYIYWTTSNYLHRLAITNLSSNIIATDVINWQLLNSAIYHPMLVSMGDLFVGHGGSIGTVDTFNVRSDGIVMDSTGVVKKINDLGSSIRVITIGSLGNSNIYLWDGVNTSPDQTIPLKGFDIRQSEIFNGFNYIITNKGLGILDGYNIYPVKNRTDFNDNINSITIHNEKLCIGGLGGIYTYGAKNKNYVESLNLEYSTSNGSSSDVIGAIYSDGTDLYVSWSNGSTYGIDKLSTSAYYTNGEYITRGYYGNSLYEIKEGLRLYLGFKKLITGQEIKISYSIDGGAYTLLYTITSSTSLPNDFTTDISLDHLYFQYIQFKIELVGDGTNTPDVYCVDMVFNSNLRR